MFDELKQIREAALKELEAVKNADELSELNTAVLGRGGKLTAILRTMGRLSAEERAELGKRANLVKQELAEKFEERRAKLSELAEQKKIEREAIDVTLPGRRKAAGTGALNPLTLIYREIRDALVGLGFTTFEGPEVEYDEY
ncbi:MAG: phenylalanine--tRNA ligase subunit alpha, partial [Clostridia bacterium]|nr:phenylalanine--tRNA ligase subunit alpha [Clostridia bacterium]